LINILSVFAFLLILERIIPVRKPSEVTSWTIRVIAINFVQLVVVTLAGYTWEKWLSSNTLLNLSKHVGSIFGGMIAYFIATFVFYWWHRWSHKIDYLWKHFHKIHHSPQRLEEINPSINTL
jgi:sterol desaturase/sphingolipid hydroxylase (fatty acid hydroxylase superfamily)